MLQIAVHFYEKGHYPTDQPAKPGSTRKLKMPGYQVSKANYQILRLLIPDLVTDIPRSRIVEYRYIQVDDAVQQQSHYFLLPITEAQLPQVEAITKTERRPAVYLWRGEGWWAFPQLETYTDGEMETYTITVKDYGTLSALNTANPIDVRTETRQIEKTKIRVRETYEASKGPGFLLAQSAPTPNSTPKGFPTSITGNGMVLEWKRGYEDKNPCWWLRDEKRVSKAQSATYRHYAAIKSVSNTRWSKTFGAWYFTGGQQPPQRWLELVGYGSTPAMPPQLAQQIEDVLVQDEGQPPELVPLKLIEANYGQHEWNFGNPEVWLKLSNPAENWVLFVANASLTERSLYGYQLHLKGVLRGEWIHLSIPDLDPAYIQRDPHFQRQSLAQAVRAFVRDHRSELPDEVLTRLSIPSDVETRRLAFLERQREIAAELEAKRALAAAMKPYHEYQALLNMQQHFAETYHRVMRCKALPALATPPLDDPWS